MPLERDAAPRFTLDQRDEILNLAARLQVQHEATVGADDLVREAEAAGIEARFVHEATMRLGRKSRPALTGRGPLIVFAVLTLQVCFAMARLRYWDSVGSDPFDLLTVLLDLGLPFLYALWVARDRSLRRFVPLAPIAVWIAVILASKGHDLVLEATFRPLPAATLEFVALQFVAASIGTIVATIRDRSPKGARSFRLYRGEKA